MGQSQSGVPAHDQQATIPFDCSVCLETKTNIGHSPRQIEGSDVCADCVRDGIVPLFVAAIDYEYEYPPNWGGTKLEAKDFVDALGPDFVDRYQRIEEEYQTTGHRTYCKHIIRATRRRPRGANCPFGSAFYSNAVEIRWMKQDGELLHECAHMLTAWSPTNYEKMVCYHCGGTTCLRCETPLVFTFAHTCNPVDYSTPKDIFKDQVRGKDYQVCPKDDCSNVVSLADGCNAISCNICRTSFCFVCGSKAMDNSDHWAQGKACPRWNQPGTSNAMFDPPEADDHPVDEVLRVFIEMAIERGEARLQANDGHIQIDAQMLNEVFQEMAAIGFFEGGLPLPVGEEEVEAFRRTIQHW